MAPAVQYCPEKKLKAKIIQAIAENSKMPIWKKPRKKEGCSQVGKNRECLDTIREGSRPK
jgi:hypothetical protein